MYENRGKRGNQEQQQKRERDRQIASFSRTQKVEDQCAYCPSSESGFGCGFGVQPGSWQSKGRCLVTKPWRTSVPTVPSFLTRSHICHPITHVSRDCIFICHRISHTCVTLSHAGARRPKHLVIALGLSAYLMLPPRGRLAPGHCLIVPADHVPSMRQV